ncbi:MAG: DegV family protein [Candidatus Thorarchaeota archaeon]
MSIRIVTDSSSDITWEYADRNKIKIVPLTIRIGNQIVKESREYNFEEHYNNYITDKHFSPKTSQPTPQEFFTTFDELNKEGAKNIIVICISSKLSGTLNSAQVAKNLFSEKYDNVKIHLIDSKNASFGEGFLVEEAVELINQGYQAENIVKELEELVENIHSFLLIPTLKYLYLGGRISITKYLLAKFLRKMAIIKTAEDGTLQPVGAIGSVEEGISKIIKLATKEGKNYPRKMTIVYAVNADLKDEAHKYITNFLPSEKITSVKTRAAITAHVGPSAIAIVFDFGKRK